MKVKTYYRHSDTPQFKNIIAVYCFKNFCLILSDRAACNTCTTIMMHKLSCTVVYNSLNVYEELDWYKMSQEGLCFSNSSPDIP